MLILGITLDAHNTQAFEFETLETMVRDFLGKKRKLDDGTIQKTDDDQRPPPLKKMITTAEYDKITLTKRSEILTKHVQKTYKCVNTKGIIDRNTNIVFPFGYH